ncbi:BolA family protein [Aliiroseovarius sp. F47248L]|uniref:BolA family protein n=1 Tax=Aliiroseovarius sp. F47248L TaxID=2926420 RepID=UPI001FF4CCCD|nr:BolA family protein [Aliiroseovarius sp. F47248L]MCK0138991.1 BolA family transcriptional regulator [Aliiroseovarius sp. F47248L]
MNRADQIYQALDAAFSPQHLEVIDESESHRGHAGYQEGGQSHFRVVIRASMFGEMTRVARHRAIHAALGAELVGQIHALALDVAS